MYGTSSASRYAGDGVGMEARDLVALRLLKPVAAGDNASEGLTGNESDSAGLAASTAEACLCVFDVDRTLTGKQGLRSRCPRNAVQRGVFDPAYGGGYLTLSDLAQYLQSTACAQCYLGVVSTGAAGGHAMKASIRRALQGRGHIPEVWSYPGDVSSPLILGCSHKLACVGEVAAWYASQDISISAGAVYYFDDQRDHVETFHGSRFNAHQVSCSARDGAIGLCGATRAEVRKAHGVSTC